MCTDGRILRVLCAGALATALAAGCATVSYEARPEQIPELERTLAGAPYDVDAGTRLGVAYYAADRLEDARTTLQSVVANEAAPGAAYLYLGLANEELEDWAAARDAYNRYLETGSSSSVKNEIRGRLALVTRRELRAEARAALQQEDVISDEPPTANTVAVLPFRMTGLSDELQPLQTALADMIITDLSLTSLQSLERVRVQSMLDEMVLAQAGFTTQESGARMGRLLKAEHVVQGVMSGAGNELALDASVLATAAQATLDEVNRRGTIESIFDLEKQLVFDILDALNITVTAAEREAITSNRTGSLVAFIAYGRGLEALDRGDYGEALSQFQQASELDPAFSAARVQQVEADQLSSAASSSPDQVAEAGITEVGAPAGTGDLAADILDQVNFSPASTMTSTQTPTTQTQERNPSTEQRTEPTTTQATPVRVIIVIPRPGGGQ